MGWDLFECCFTRTSSNTFSNHKYWIQNEVDSLATILSTKVEDQALLEFFDPGLGFQSDLKIKQMMIATAELASQCLRCPLELRPSMEQVLETLNGIKQGKYETSPMKAFKIFHHAELEEATNHFDTFLGKGGFGTVYYGKLKDGREVAIKRFYGETDKTIKQFMKEIEILCLLQHQNLVSLYGCSSRHSDKYMLVYEYISNGTLSEHLRESSCGKLAWPTRLNIAIETATCLAVAELAFQCVQCPKDLRPSMKQVLETLEGIRKGTWGFNQIT
ncbi:Serine-threonine/tyrosine-protein kinase, catalytic domain [Sesbania bispinosa]|nr:Serine-threonine/tyrosine-protein kinase, catalytic domain [Sesbania bispinosa]